MRTDKHGHLDNRGRESDSHAGKLGEDEDNDAHALVTRVMMQLNPHQNLVITPLLLGIFAVSDVKWGFVWLFN